MDVLLHQMARMLGVPWEEDRGRSLEDKQRTGPHLHHEQMEVKSGGRVDYGQDQPASPESGSTPMASVQLLLSLCDILARLHVEQ
ncbi:hypothetical protein MHYP_G00341740 [Metynnis hypsauchen]